MTGATAKTQMQQRSFSWRCLLPLLLLLWAARLCLSKPLNISRDIVPNGTIPPQQLPDGLPPSASGLLPKQWEVDAGQLWDTYGSKASFCLGSQLQGVVDVLQQSFPYPLPVGPSDDLLCSNAVSIEAHLCEPEEVLMYYQYLLRTEDLEKVPSNILCQTGGGDPSCSPGFFSNNITGQPVPHACCPGYFCPVMLTCMIPCPLGSHCPRSWPSDPPAGYLDYDLHQKLFPVPDKWCSPYAYKQRPNIGCGGADKWPILPTGAFPGLPWDGSGNIYCDGGWFCPNTFTKRQCTSGHYCRQGSTEMMRCPPLAKCPIGTQTPTDNYAGVALDLALFVLLGLLWRASRVHASFMRFIIKRSRLALACRHFGLKVVVTDVAAERPRQFGASLQEDTHEAVQPLLPTSVGGGDRGGARLLFWRRRSSSQEGSDSTVRSPVWARLDLPQQSDVQMVSGSLQTAGLQATGNYESGDREVMRPIAAGGGAGRAQSVREDLLRADATVTVGATGGGTLSILQRQGNPKVPLELQFWRLALTLRRTAVRVLDGASGGLRASRLTAIMGPSGAGKTTLMSTLAGKTPYGVRSGTVLVNGVAESLEKYRPVTGFVPQEDIMHRCLTVEEVLLFSARLRLPAGSGDSAHLLAVEYALEVLGLREIRYQVIGDEETRGISGGQRKRVNVGIELVADPSLLFLDEPTSGLDSTASRLVVAAVRQVAQAGVTATAVIHQPSYQVFQMFDDVILLAKGGRTAYYGPVSGVQAYFEGLGLFVPQHINPADAYLDFITGSISPSETPSGDPQRGAFNLADEWELHNPAPDGLSEQRPSATSVPDTTGGDLSWSWVLHQLTTTPTHLPKAACEALQSWWAHNSSMQRKALRVQPGFRQQLSWWCSRAAIRRMREPMVIITEYAIFALTGSLLGLMSTRGRGNILRFAGDTMYTIVALGLLSSVSGLKTFGRERVVFFREAASGLNRAAFFVANDLMELPGGLLRSAAYLVMYCSFAQPRAVAWQMYVVTAGIVYCCTGSAYFLSIVLEQSAAQLTAAVLALVNTLMAHRHNPGGLLQLAQTFSFARWGLEGYIIAESNMLVGVWLLSRCADLMALGYDVTRFWFCLFVLALLGVVFRVAACVALYVVHRDK